MKIDYAEFVKSAPSLKDCPEWDLPEVTLVGRSNVGKSSLINMLLGRKNLAKTSNTPGKTRLINFYEINRAPNAWSFVDLPGYGYAKVSKSMQQEWQKNLERYLSKRNNLVLVLHLIDTRIPPQASDAQMAQWLAYQQLPTVAVLTKSDGVKTNELKKRLISPLGHDEPVEYVNIVGVSAKSKAGKDELFGVIESHLKLN